MILHGNTAQAYNLLKDSKYTSETVVHIEKALLIIREIDATVTYAGLDPEQMMNVKNSMKDKYYEKFLYRKAKAL